VRAECAARGRREDEEAAATLTVRRSPDVAQPRERLQSIRHMGMHRLLPPLNGPDMSLRRDCSRAGEMLSLERYGIARTSSAWREKATSYARRRQRA